MKQLFLLFLVLVGMIVVASWLTKQNNLSLTGEKQIKVGNITLLVEVADTPGKHEKGLSGRAEIADNQGMLFVMPPDSTPSFWLRGMQFPIDILWINDGKVAEILENLSPPSLDTSPTSLVHYKPQQPVDYALEVKAGFTAQNNISVGTMVELP